MHWKPYVVWLYGLLDAVISGAAGAISVVIVDPTDFNIYEGRSRLVAVTLTMALVGAANYLKSRHLPLPWDGIDRRIDSGGR